MSPQDDSQPSADALEEFLRKERTPEEIARLRLEEQPLEGRLAVEVRETKKQKAAAREAAAKAPKPVPRSTQWARDNPERARARDEAWREAHPEKVREAGRDHYHRNREQRLQDAATRKDSPEGKRRAAEYQRKYRQDPEKRRKHKEAMDKLRATPEFQQRQRERAALEKRLKELGLPPRRLHKVPAALRRAAEKESTEWFGRRRNQKQIALIKREARPSQAQEADAREKDPQQVQKRITHAVRSKSTADELLAEVLARYGTKLEDLVVATNMRRAATGRPTRRVAAAVRASANDLVASYFKANAPGEIAVDHDAFFQAVEPRLRQATAHPARQPSAPAVSLPRPTSGPGVT